MNYTPEQLLPLVGQLAEKYTSRESTSVTEQTARQLMEAVIFCLGQAEEEADSGGVDGLRTVSSARLSPQEAYEAGYRLCTRKFSRANLVYVRLMEDFHSYGNRALRDTVSGGLPLFFERYDPRFRPQDQLLTLDYPILGGLGGRRGVDAVCHFLTCVRLEQSFLHNLAEAQVREMLAVYNDEYEELVFNLCAVVQRKLLGSLIADQPMGKTRFDSSDYTHIVKFVEDSRKDELVRRLTGLLRLLLSRWRPSRNERMFAYLSLDIPDFAVELMNAVRYGCLDTIV